MMITMNCPGCGSLLEVDDDGGYCDECDSWYELDDFEDEDEDYEDEEELQTALQADKSLTDEERTDRLIVAEVMMDEDLIQVNISVRQAWLLVNAIQLAVRHPELHEPTVKALTETARQFQAAVVAVHPDAGELLEKGWNPIYDQ
jgi:hypothetical protein